MRTELFDFELPGELIAAYPSEKRGEDRLLVLNRKDGSLTHSQFPDILNFLRPGDLLVVNDTKVRKARLYARKPSGGRVELLLLSPLGDRRWGCLAGSSRPLKEGTELELKPGLSAVFERRTGATVTIRFNRELAEEEIERLGEMPLPPYILRKRQSGHVEGVDDSRYQTVFASVPGAVAAPTAGLHFTAEILEQAAAAGVGQCRITLEAGWGTFAPVKSETIENHSMHSERYSISEQAADALNRAVAEKRRLIAVGTTVARTLESAAGEGRFRPVSGSTDIFILPGYRFRAVDCLLTNFHTPRSTLLMLVSAFVGRTNILAAYEEAVQERYRFYSYGDAMFIQ